MDLDEYLWFTRTTLKKFSEKMEFSVTGISQVKHFVRSPSLLNTVKLIIESEGKITPQELLCKKDVKTLEEWKKRRDEKNEQDK